MSASEAVKECAESVKADNPDLTKSQAFAICQSMENEGELSAGEIYDRIHDLGLEDWVDDAALERLEARREASAAVRVHRGLALGRGVSRVENDDGSVTYRNLAILAPGEWTDAATEETIFYSPEATERIAEAPDEHVVDTTVNVDHEHDAQLQQVGSFEPDSLTVDDEGTLYADVTLHGRTQASEDAIGLMDLALESDGERGAGGPSVEIPHAGERTEFDADRGMEKLVEFDLSGLAIVTHSASEDVAFEEQFADRAVAMSDGATDGVRVMAAGETVNGATRPDDDMDQDAIKALLDEATLDADDVASPDDIPSEADIMALIDKRFEELQANSDGDAGTDLQGDGDAGHDLQGDGDLEMVAEMIERAEGEGFDPGEQSAADLLDFLDENMDIGDDAEAALMDVADAYLEAVDAESLDATPAADLLDWVREQGDADADGGDAGDDADDDGDEGDGEEMSDGEALQAKIEALERELEAVKADPEPPTDFGDDKDADDDSRAPTATPGTVVRRNGHLSR